MLDTTQRYGVCLSSGYFGFFAHFGFMQGLRGLGIEPTALTGSSAGALVGSMFASGLEEDRICETLTSISLADFLDPPKISHLFSLPAGVVSGTRLERRLNALLPVSSFEDCPIPLGVSVFDLEQGVPKVVGTGPLAPAIRASVSLPGMFCPTYLDGHLCWDGGVADKTPIAALADREDVDAVLVCYLPRDRGPRPPKSIMGGIRASMDALIRSRGLQQIAAARNAGKEVYIIAPKVSRSGPFRLAAGPAIMAEAEAETRRIVEQGQFGYAEMS